LAVQMMLEWLGTRKGDKGLVDAANGVEAAVASVLKDGKVLTYDLGGKAKGSEVGSAIADRVAPGRRGERATRGRSSSRRSHRGG